jgi:hypothetical protein
MVRANRSSQHLKRSTTCEMEKKIVYQSLEVVWQSLNSGASVNWRVGGGGRLGG